MNLIYYRNILLKQIFDWLLETVYACICINLKYNVEHSIFFPYFSVSLSSETFRKVVFTDNNAAEEIIMLPYMMYLRKYFEAE